MNRISLSTFPVNIAIKPSTFKSELNQKLIALLQANGRASSIEFASAVGVSEGTVRRRFQNLVRQQLIRVVSIPDPAGWGMLPAFGEGSVDRPFCRGPGGSQLG